MYPKNSAKKSEKKSSVVSMPACDDGCRAVRIALAAQPDAWAAYHGAIRTIDRFKAGAETHFPGLQYYVYYDPDSRTDRYSPACPPAGAMCQRRGLLLSKCFTNSRLQVVYTEAAFLNSGDVQDDEEDGAGLWLGGRSLQSASH